MYLTEIQSNMLKRFKVEHQLTPYLDMRYMFGPDMVEYSRAYSLIRKLEKKGFYKKINNPDQHFGRSCYLFELQKELPNV